MFNQYQNADVLLVHLSSIVMSSLPGNKVQQKIERICIANCNTEPVTLNLGNNEMDIAMKAGSADNVLDLTLRDAIKGSESSCCNSEYTNVVKWSIPPLPQLLFCSQQIALFVPPTNPEVEGDEGCWIHNGCKLDRFGKATLSRSPQNTLACKYEVIAMITFHRSSSSQGPGNANEGHYTCFRRGTTFCFAIFWFGRIKLMF
jgi:hypothetical protein